MLLISFMHERSLVLGGECCSARLIHTVRVYEDTQQFVHTTLRKHNVSMHRSLDQTSNLAEHGAVV